MTPSRLASPVEGSLGSGRAKFSMGCDFPMPFLCLLLAQSTSFRRNFSSPLLVHEPPPACAMSRESPPTGECPSHPMAPASSSVIRNPHISQMGTGVTLTLPVPGTPTTSFSRSSCPNVVFIHIDLPFSHFTEQLLSARHCVRHWDTVLEKVGFMV